jgi:hypothetical protein
MKISGPIRYALCAATALLAGCTSSQPPIDAQRAMPYTLATVPMTSASSDMTSILKRLKKNVLIGKTVGPTNGDRGPYGLAADSGMRCRCGDPRRHSVPVGAFERRSSIGARRPKSSVWLPPERMTAIRRSSLPIAIRTSSER